MNDKRKTFKLMLSREARTKFFRNHIQVEHAHEQKENIKAYTVVAFGWPAFFLDPFFANILWHFCANLRWIFINMVMINLVTMWLW